MILLPGDFGPTSFVHCLAFLGVGSFHALKQQGLHVRYASSQIFILEFLTVKLQLWRSNKYDRSSTHSVRSCTKGAKHGEGWEAPQQEICLKVSYILLGEELTSVGHTSRIGWLLWHFLDHFAGKFCTLRLGAVPGTAKQAVFWAQPVPILFKVPLNGHISSLAEKTTALGAVLREYIELGFGPLLCVLLHFALYLPKAQLEALWGYYRNSTQETECWLKDVQVMQEIYLLDNLKGTKGYRVKCVSSLWPGNPVVLIC